MKNILTLSIIILLSIASQAQAADGASSYVLKKQVEAAQTKRQSESLVNKLRNLPEGATYIVNTTPKIAAKNKEEELLGAEELDAIATAAGNSEGRSAASQK